MFFVFYFTGLRITMSSSQGSGQRPVYVDLDAPENMDVANQVGSSSTPSSSSKGKKRKQPAHKRDPDYPPPEYSQFLREVAVNYYRFRSRDMLSREFLNKGEAGIRSLQLDMEREFWARLAESEQYMDCQTKFFQAPKWIEQMVTTATTNATHVFDCVVKKPRGEEHSDEDKEFLEKLKWV